MLLVECILPPVSDKYSFWGGGGQNIVPHGVLL